MKLESNLINEVTDKEEFKIIAEDCTLSQAFTMIENWCHDNEAKIDWWNAYKESWSIDFFIECYREDELVNTFIISE